MLLDEFKKEFMDKCGIGEEEYSEIKREIESIGSFWHVCVCLMVLAIAGLVCGVAGYLFCMFVF